MRLIDANEVKRFYEEEFSDLDNGVHWSRNDIICNLDNIPTVKAIPVKWLKAKAEKWASSNDVLMWGQCVKLLIEDWEKENEAD